MGGNRYWGDVVLEFNEDFTAFTGDWNRCGGEIVTRWTGTRASVEEAGSESLPNSPVSN
ncbi:MAG: hypothetical protein QNJ67_19300 [Kiloniellales bacterium]|nr:hypothetical protein [Kiloniellales bacterium]